jgi:hypothetical protein
VWSLGRKVVSFRSYKENHSIGQLQREKELLQLATYFSYRLREQSVAKEFDELSLVEGRTQLREFIYSGHAEMTSYSR